MNAKDKAKQLYDLIKPSIIDDSELNWWHTFAKSKAIMIVSEVFIPRLDYLFENDADLLTETLYWDNVIAEIMNVQLGDEVQCGVGKNNI